MRYLSFLPFTIASLAHLATLVAQDATGSTVTKLLLMPALLLALLWALGARFGVIVLLAGLGILFSWAGDALIQSPGDIGFLLGLGCFFAAHLAYLLLFLRPLRERKVPWALLALVAWWLLLVIYLAPYIGGLLVPVAAYGLVLGASTATAFGTNRVVAVGAVAFLVSDTLLAFKLFLPDWDFYPIDAIIMAFYVVGQGLIAAGVVRRVRAIRESSAPSSPAT